MAAAVAEGLRLEGLGLLHWTPAARQLRARLAAAHAGLGDPWPAVDDDALLAAIDVSGARSRADLTRLDVVAALRALVPWQVAGDLDAVVPERVEVPTGSRIRVDYTDPDRPDALGAGAGGVRLGAGTAGRRPSAAAAAALPRPAGRRHHRGPRRVLGHRLPRRPQRAARPLPPPPVAGGPGSGIRHEAGPTAPLTLRASPAPARIGR